MAVRRVPREAPGGVRLRERPPVLATAASRQAKHHPVYPVTRTVRGAIRDRLGEPWGYVGSLYKYALLHSERLRPITLILTQGDDTTSDTGRIQRITYSL